MKAAVCAELGLRAGDWVEVRSREEILSTLDKNGRLDELPFMPQMLQYCGQRIRVSRRAHKTCDTIENSGGRRMANAVHLEDIRCDGQAYGGCQANCLIFWKEAWLKRPDVSPRHSQETVASRHGDRVSVQSPDLCSETDVIAGTRARGEFTGTEPTYVCQATQLLKATEPLAWWDARQYLEDWTSGNVSLGRLLGALFLAGYFHLINAGIGLGRPLRWLYGFFVRLFGGTPYPWQQGTISLGSKTPSADLNLQPGEWVRVKSHAEILATLDRANRNRGLFFDVEEVPYCGGTYQVLRRVNRLIDEKTGRLTQLKTESVMLAGVCCGGIYSRKRLLCPRGIYSIWREVWLERAAAVGSATEAGKAGASPEGGSHHPSGKCHTL